MDNRETSVDVVIEYTGFGCSVPKDITSVRFKRGLQKIGDGAFGERTSLYAAAQASKIHMSYVEETYSSLLVWYYLLQDLFI